MIVLWGMAGDAPLDDVRSALDRLGAEYSFVDQEAAPDLEVDLCPEDGGSMAGSVGGIDLRAVGAAYIRPGEPVLHGDGPRTRKAAAVDAALVTWADLAPGLVLNRPAAMAANNSKPYQLLLLRAHGFTVPETIVTTDPATVLAFRAKHGDVIYKSVSGVRSVVSRFRDEHIARISDVMNSPTQFQEYVPGQDVRVHVVGDTVFATAVHSAADDYRYDPHGIELLPTTIPAQVADRSRAAAHRLGLPLAGLDLRRTPAGEWVCFEMNPSPAFSFYERATGQPIAAAVAALLQLGDRVASARVAR